MTPPPVVENFRAYALLAMTALCWGGNAVFGRLAVGEISPMLLVCLRWLGVVLLVACFASGYVRKDWHILKQHLLFIGAMGALGFTAFNALFYVAAHHTTAINIGIIQGSIPVFVIIGAFFAFSTRVTPMQITGVLLTMLGVGFVASEGNLVRLASMTVNYGDALMVLACLFYAGYAVGLVRRPLVSAMAFFTAIAVAAFIASVPLAAAELVTGRLQWPTLTGWIVVGLITLFPSFLAQIFFIRGVELIGPGRAGVFVNLVPVFASLLAVGLLGESFEVYHGVALCAVVGGIWLSEHGKPGQQTVEVRESEHE